ncbi:MAG: hypothetical protein GY705_23450 [Bacteroidetes bacterium]|nr:hypothetical protein [Bacteroidota bacterium]
MSKIVREDIDNLNAALTVTIERADYEPKFNEELNKYRKDAQLKGFRKGKTPLNFIKKKYGKAVLGQVVQEAISHELQTYLTDNKIAYLGNVLSSKDQKNYEFNPKEMGDYDFKFDLGLTPEFELQGISKEKTFEKYKPTVSRETLEKNLENIRKEFGKRTIVEEDIQENDVVKLHARELENDIIKNKGWDSEFTILVENIESEEIKAELLSKKKGDVIRINIMSLLKNTEEEYIRKYLLGIEEDENEEKIIVGDEFEATITEISRFQLAELNQDFFDKLFGPEPKIDEEKAFEKLEENHLAPYQGQAENLLFIDIQDYLFEENSLELPDVFLKRWLVTTNEKLTEELLEKQYDAFSKNLQWKLISQKIAEKHGHGASEEEVKAKVQEKVIRYFIQNRQPIDQGTIQNAINQVLSNREEVMNISEEIVAEKNFGAIKEEVTIEDKEITIEDFDKLIMEMNKQAKEEQGTIEEAQNREEEE